MVLHLNAMEVDYRRPCSTKSAPGETGSSRRVSHVVAWCPFRS